MTREYYTFVSGSTALGILRWVAAIALVALAVFFLVRQIKTKKSLSFITTFISALILVPMLILAPVQVKIEPGTPEPQPVDPIPQVDPEPEPTPEPEPEPISPVTPSNNTPNTKPSGNQTPSTPDKPETPVAPDEPDTPEEPEVSAKYTVIHRQQNLENDDYTVAESESKTGVAGKTATPATKTYPGFIAPTTKTATIAKDGSTEIVYDYNRELIALVLEDADDTASSLPAGNYKYGTQVTLTAKDRVGYVFANWNNGKTTKNISIELTEAASIKPIYTPNTYLVSFDKNNSAANGSMSTQTLTYDQAEKLSKNSFILEGYTFDHWNTESNDTGSRYADEESVQNLLAEGEITLYAFWTANTNTAYTVNHYKQNIGGGDNYTLAKTEDKTGTTDTMATPNRESYTGFTAPAAQSKKITGDGHMAIDYYYTRNQYTVTFGDNAVQISSDVFINGQKYYYEQTGTLTAGTRTGYTFTGWSDNATDASRSFTVGAEDATIGANYRANNYTVVFHANYPNNSATASQSFTYDQAPTSLAENSFSRPGYDFDHWSVNPNDSGTGYGDKEEVQNLTSIDDGEYHLYAQWTARTYTIAFNKNADDATGSMNPQGMTYDQAANLSANQFQRANYNFKGWSTNPNATTKEYSDGEEVINLATSGTVTLYAVWEDKFPVVFSIEGDCIFNGKDSTITTSSTCQFNDTDYVGQTFIDTGISLNTSENFDKDYEISFNIDSYSPNQVEAQAAFVSNKISTTHPTSQLPNPPSPLPQAKSPGVVVRKSGDNIDIRSALLNETGSGYLEANYVKPYTEFQTIKIVRHNRIVYISINGGNLFELQDVSDFHQYFNQTTWFGAYPNDGTEDPEPKNVLVGTLSNLSIRLGEMDWNYYQVEFDAKSGTLDNSYKKVQIEKGTSIETLPVTTRKKYIFDGWFIGNTQISDGYTPTEDVKITAKWARNVQQAIASPSSFELARGDEAYLTITNKNNIEPFTMSSSNDQIATIGQDGKVTAVSNGQANIVLTGSRSGEIFEIPVTVTLPRYTVHFDTKGGNEIADITNVEEGSSIGTLPADPTRTGYVFDGWFLESSDTEFTTSTPITGNTNVEAHWTMDITNAVVSNISITRGESAQVNVTNANELEPFTYRSDNTNIITVDGNGNITTVAAGSTTITLVGSRSTLEATLNVSVALPKYIVHFNAHGGSDVADITGITEGDSISTLPTSSLEHYVLDGWYTTENGGEKLTTSTPIMGETTYHAHWKKDITQAILSSDSFTLMAGTSEVFSITNSDELEPYSVATGNNTIAVADNDAIRALSEGETTLIITGEKSGLTKTATITITHGEFTIQFDAGDGTASQNSIAVDAGGTISELPTAELSGYAFDGWWTAAEGGTRLTTETIINEEKTYYAHWLIIMCKLVPKEELHTETCNNSGGCAATSPAKIHSIGDTITYGTAASSTTPKGGDAYDCAIAKDSSNNITTKRFYYLTNNEENAILMYSETMGKGFKYNEVESKLPTAADWNLLTVQFANGKPTRLPTKSEIQAACQTASETFGSLNSCEYLMEGTKYAVGGNVLPTGLILNVESDNSYWRIMSNNRAVNSTTSASGNGIVPVIEVPLKQLEKYTEKIVQFNIQSEAAQEYFANVDTWNANNDKDAFLKAMKANFDDANRSGDGSRRCIYSGSPDITTSTSIFPNTYRYEENGGTVYCDRPAAYDTGVGGNIKVYLSNENREKGAEATYLKTDNGLIENMIPGTIYRWESEADSNVYGYVKATGERRFITLSSARNVRDLGGLTGAYGTLKYGRLMRGEKLGGDDVSDLRKLGITMEYELRENVQSPRMGTHSNAVDDADVYKQRMTIHYDINPADARGSGYYDITRSVLAEFMQDVIDGKNIYFHCSHGADRTGTIAYLAEGLLGIDYETRSRDYELTSLSGRADRTRYYEKKSESDASDPSSNKYSGIKKYIYMTGFLETEQDIVNWFKAKLTTQEERDAADQLIEDFRAAMIEGYGQ